MGVVEYAHNWREILDKLTVETLKQTKLMQKMPQGVHGPSEWCGKFLKTNIEPGV